MSTLELLAIIIPLLGGGGIGGFLIGRRKRNAEGQSIEVDSSVKINREWERLYKELKADYVQLSERVDALEEELLRERMEVERLKSAG
jgi:hypothetical protein